MSTFQTILVLGSSLTAFNVLLVWFLHKASNHFHKLDNAVGNIETK